MGLFDLFSSISNRLSERDDADPAIRAETERCLDTAVAQRVVMAVTFDNRRLAGLDFSGPCMLVKVDTLILDSAVQGGHATCLGQPVTVYFRLEREGDVQFYSFSSKICGCGQSRGFVLEKPVELGSNQRREFARVTPPPETVLFLEAWAVAEGELPPPHGLKSALPPDGSARSNMGISLVNVSAGGIRLKVDNDDHELARCRQAGAHLACFLRFRPIPDDPKVKPGSAAGNEGALHLWLACSVTHSLEQEGLYLGAVCRAWASNEEQPEPTAWTAAGEHGLIPPLSTWIWKQQRNRFARYR